MSETAKSGFIAEDQVVSEFENKTQNARIWLIGMGYDGSESISAKTTRAMGKITKADVMVSVDGTDIGISVKKFTASFNQIDKRWVDQYSELWDIPVSVANTLKRYCGEFGFQPQDHGIRTRDPRRYFLDELDTSERNNLIDFFEENRERIMNDVLRGTGDFKADYILVVKKDGDKIMESGLISVEKAIKHYDGSISVTKRGNIKIGKITVQRKGGNGGGKTAQMLQFKFSPKDILSL